MKKLMVIILLIAGLQTAMANTWQDTWGYNNLVLSIIRDEINDSLATITGPVVNSEKMGNLIETIHGHYRYREQSEEYLHSFWHVEAKFEKLDSCLAEIHDVYWHTFWDRDSGGRVAALLSDLCGQKITHVESRLTTFGLIALIVIALLILKFSFGAKRNFQDDKIVKGILQAAIAVTLLWWAFQ